VNQKSRIAVRDVMKKNFDLIDGMTTIADALRKMKYVETKCLIVTKRDENDEFGLLLLSDIARLVLAKDRSPERVNVYEVMTKPVIAVAPDMDIRYCARLFDRFDLSRAPVLENGEVIGVVSLTDTVLRGMCRED